jgi:hypothetical protein
MAVYDGWTGIIAPSDVADQFQKFPRNFQRAVQLIETDGESRWRGCRVSAVGFT